MSIYTNTNSYGKKAAKVTPMRAAETAQEGLLVHTAAADEEAIARLHKEGYEGTANAEQRANQLQPVRFVSDLRPVPTLLQTKRSRRCKECRHILVRPEPKVTSTRFRIKLVAYEHVPSMGLAPLPPPSSAQGLGPGPPTKTIDLNALPPSQPLQFTLATPSNTSASPSQPGATSRVTILCPQFEVGSNTDVWDEALTSDASKRMSKLGLSATSKTSENEGKVAEAGKVWEKGRNWTTVVLEVVCGRILANNERHGVDEDVLEIPIFVRIEYETVAQGDEGTTLSKGGEEKKEKRELAYWSVLGVGKIARVKA
jgi:dynactin-4